MKKEQTECSETLAFKIQTPMAQAIFQAKPFHVQYPTFSTAVTLHTHSPMKMEQTGCSKTLAFKPQTPRNNPEESKRHSKHGVSSKSRTLYFLNMYPHWAIFKIITHLLCLVNEQKTYASSASDVLLICAVGNSEYTECRKSHLKLDFQQHKIPYRRGSPSSLKNDVC
jgi:hypothetical protein